MRITLGRIIATIMVASIVIYIASGMVAPKAETEAKSNAPENVLLKSVQYTISEGEILEPTLSLTGKTQAEKKVHVAAEVSGKINEVLFKKGDLVEAGNIIARIDLNDVRAQLSSAIASEKQSRLELEATQQLVKKGLQKQTQLAAAEAMYEQSKSQRLSLEIRLNNTDIRAPFDGVLNTLDVEVGSYVNVGQSIGEIISFDPIIITAQVSENDILSVTKGMMATAVLLDKRKINGEVTYISSLANQQTRTFTVEISAKNSINAGEGLTAQMTLFKKGEIAHFISPVYLSLNDNGELGVKTLSNDDKVVFSPVKILSSEPNGVWLSGLTPATKLIVVGQGFVNAGDKVIAVEQVK